MSLKKKIRNKDILDLITLGNTCEDVGRVFGISKQRVNQIVWEDGVHRAKKRNPAMVKHLRETGCSNKDITISILDGH